MAKQRAIIFDIDGTLAHMSGRIQRHGQKVAPYQDWDAHDDEIDEHTVHLLNALKSEFQVVICSGRKDSSADVLSKWLDDNDIHYDNIYMRKHGDNRPDYVIKKEIYENYIIPQYDIFAVFDDRDQVVDMLRHDLGLKVFQVAEGHF